MSPAAQKRLAIAGAIIVTLLFITANVRLLLVAMNSQPDCVVVADAPPAKRSC
ncbi:MAG: hypothetical protein LCH61_18175 [Proteobacteria bacterium]|nr:hypothetical protein [Pseudomonadota bacterium]